MSNVSNLIRTKKLNGVTTLTMNMPKRYNGWTFEMMTALREAFTKATHDDETKVLILTGADPYYCAGVNLSGTLKIGHPKKLHGMIVEQNQRLFEMFLDFPKPLLVAVNGPAIGACVTSATLCNAILASDRATFSTPFAKLGVSLEGCSSFLFPRILGEKNADRMLGKEGWVPTAQEALDVGLVQWVVPHGKLEAESQRIGEEWIASGEVRSYRADATKEALKAVNARESVELADAFLSPAFMDGQFRFLWSRKKRVPAAMFLLLRHTRPLWSKLL